MLHACMVDLHDALTHTKESVCGKCVGLYELPPKETGRDGAGSQVFVF